MRAPPGEAWLPVGGRWQCPDCGKQFVKPGLSHSCGQVSLEQHFAQRPRARALFNALCDTLQKAGGPFRLSVAKTRIGLINGITFAAVMPRKDFVRFHILLLRRLESARPVRIDHFPPWFVHTFELRDAHELDADMRGWLREAWSLGLR